MAQVNKISSFKSFTEVKNQEISMKLREENNAKRQETVGKIGAILDEMGLTSLSELDEDKKQALISKMFGNVSEDEAEDIEDEINKLGEPEKLEEGNPFIYAAAKAKQDGKKEFEFNGKTYKVTLSANTGISEENIIDESLNYDENTNRNYVSLIPSGGNYYQENYFESNGYNGKLTFRKTKNESEETPRFKVGLGVIPDYMFDGIGMRIDGISEEKPAQKAGLQKGDIVIQLGDSIVLDMMSYMRALSVFEKGNYNVYTLNSDETIGHLVYDYLIEKPGALPPLNRKGKNIVNNYLSNFNTISISAVQSANNITTETELAYFLAESHEHITNCISKGILIDSIASKLSFNCEIGEDQFLEISKMRF